MAGLRRADGGDLRSAGPAEVGGLHDLAGEPPGLLRELGGGAELRAHGAGGALPMRPV